MAPYSMDSRVRVLRDSDAGLSSKEVAAKYSVSRAWVDRIKQRRRETGEITPRQQQKFRRRSLSAEQEARLVFLITARPDATLVELREALPGTAALSTLWRAIDRLDLTKKTVHADEQRRPDIAVARRQWQDTQPLRDVRRYAFLDECGVATDLLRR